MTEYMELAARQLAKIAESNRDLRYRAAELRRDGATIAAAELEAEVPATSFRLAEDYIALAELAQAAAPPPAVTPDHEQEQEQEQPQGGRPVHRYLGEKTPGPGQE